jgi:hypothetical protein
MSTPHRQPPLRELALALLLGSICMTSCGPTGSTVTPTGGGGGGPGVDSDPEGTNEGRGMAELAARMKDLVRRTDDISAVAAGDAGKCENLCDLATSICSVQEKMRELCDAHPDDDNYAALCREAKNECREAQDSCVRCVESNQSK